MNLVPLFEEALEFQDYNGTVLSDGKVAVYYIGRTRLADIYEDVAAEYPAENPRILNNLGMGPIYVNPAFDYEMVVFDAYGSELFSVKKYLASKGEHSTANVVVTPSESIAVSAWTVGDVQVYMPYLTGQLGKVYTGIEPIVVNNVEDKISANHVPLGVQDPLYFVQDDEEACIIGCSAQTEIPAELSGKWDNASDVVIANSAQWAEGTEYEAGSYVDINNNTISVTGLSPVPADTASTGLVAQVSADITAMIPDTSDMATQTWINEQGFLTAHQDISNKLDTTAFSTVSGDFLTAIPSEYVTENTLQSGLSSKLDSTAFSTVSGDFLTAHQSLDGLMSASLLEQSGGLITGYNGSAFAGQGGGVTGDYELSAGSGISIVDFPLEQKTVISVTAQGGNPEVEQAVIDNSATWNDVTAKADITAIPSTAGLATTGDLQTVSGEITAMIPSTAGLATENWVTGQGYITNDAITGKQDITGMTAYATVESLTAKQDAGDYLSATDSANFLLTSDSGNFYTTANESGFITNDAITGKQDITGMTAYQPIGAYLTTADSANFYTTANESGFISEVPDTYLQNTDLTIVDNKITEISGVPLSAGDELPSGVMNTSALGYNAVNEISGYNGSAIAQYGAEKQWLVTDDTLLTLSNSAQFAIGVNISAVQQLMGIDETVLWTGTDFSVTNGNHLSATVQLSEPISAFNEIKIISSGNLDCETIILDPSKLGGNGAFTWMAVEGGNSNWIGMRGVFTDQTHLKVYGGYSNSLASVFTANGWWNYKNIYKIIGIGKKV